MQAMRNDMIKVGDYVQFRGHRVQEALTTMWWKATLITDDTVHLINRHGATARVSRSRRYHHMRALKWEPEDRRTDG